jgi:hypothetical protein
MQTELAQAHPPPPPAGGFDAGEVILGHVSNSSHEHPLIHLPTIFGIDFSVTKHVLMLWIVAGGLFLLLTWIVRRYARKDRPVPDKLMSVLEIGVEFVRDTIIEPYVGHHWAKTWTPLLLSIFVFVLFANAIGLVPIFDVLALANVVDADVGLGTAGHGASHFFADKEIRITAQIFRAADRVMIGQRDQVHAAFTQHGVNIARSTVAFQKKMAQDSDRQGARVKRVDVQVASHCGKV